MEGVKLVSHSSRCRGSVLAWVGWQCMFEVLSGIWIEFGCKYSL